MAERRVGNPGRMWVEMGRGQNSDLIDPNNFYLGFPDQAEDPGYPANFWMQKVKDAAARVAAPVGDSAHRAWTSWLDQQQNGTLMEKITDPNIARWLGMGREPTAQAAPTAESAMQDAPPAMVPPVPAGPGGSLMAAPAPARNLYMEELSKLIMSGGAGGAPRVSGSYPAAPQMSINIPGYTNRPVPQRGQTAEPDYTQADQYLDAAKPQGYEPDKMDMIASILGGAAGGFGDWRPGERLGAQLARAGSGAAGGYMNQKRYQDSRKDQSDREMRGYQMQRAGTSEGRENQRVSRQDRNQEIAYLNESAVRDDDLKRADYEVRAQQLQNEIANGNWQRAFSIARAMRQDDLANTQLGMQAQGQKITGLASLARTQAYANRPPSGGKNMMDLGPGAMTSKIIGEAINKSQPIPGYDISSLQQQALQVAKGDKQLQQTFALNPQLQKSWVNQWVAAQISRDLASKPDRLQSIISMYAKVPIGSQNTTIMRGLSPDNDDE